MSDGCAVRPEQRERRPPGERRLKITFVLPGLPLHPVGGARVVYEYANHLVARGHRITVLHARYPDEATRLPWREQPRVAVDLLRERMRDHVRRLPVTWHEVDPRVRLRAMPSLARPVLPPADVLVATAWTTARAGASYPARAGRKYYLVQHYETWDGDPGEVDATWRLPFRKIVIARWLYRKGLELGAPTSELRYIPNGLDHGKYRVIRPIAERPERVAMLHHRAKWKGAADGIRALELARARRPRLTAILFGTAERPPGLPDWIQYRQDPPQSALVREIYNGAAVYLCPSWTEGWHLPPAEAMACGCALVSTDIPGVADYARNGQTALLAPVRRPEQLAERLLELLEAPDRRVSLAEAGAECIRRFTWARASDRLERWFRTARSPERRSGSGSPRDSAAGS